MPNKEIEFDSLSCLLSVPPGEPPADGWPLLLFLHGHGEAAPIPIAQALTRHGPLHPKSAPIATSDFIVVGPQLPAPGGDVWAARSDLLGRLAVETARDHRGDRSRLYLTGFSYGGNGVLDVSARMPNLWAALWAVDPPRPLAARGGQPIWLSSGDLSRAHAGGLSDFVAPQPGATRVLHDAGLNHVETASNAYQDSAVYHWLLSHRSAA